MEEQERCNWAQAIPLDGSLEHIICLPLALSVGKIDEDGIGLNRASALRLLMGIYPDVAEEAVKTLLHTSERSLALLLKEVASGEPLRVWSSNVPDKACGLYWLMAQLRPIGFEYLDVTSIQLPDVEDRSDGTVVRYSGWGGVEPHQWGRLAALGKKLSLNHIRMLANRWEQLREENAPLRAMLNGQLVSMPESLYDFFILRELDAQDPEFMEAQVIGNVLGKYQLCIGDAWVALRIEQLIQDGLLEPISQPCQGDPIYHRMLRKGGCPCGTTHNSP